MTGAFELAIAKAAELPDVAREQIGRELLERIDVFLKVRADIQIGLDELDAGKGEPLDVEEFLKQVRDAAS